MQQYFAVKAKYPDAILLFRVGDFYETFGEDAKTASAVLGITLTSRNNGGDQTPLAGVPYHSLDMYLPRLVKAGYRVAICEQLEKPDKTKKLVKRGVTEVITPGVTIDDKLLDHTRNNYLAALQFGKKDQFGISFLDVSTGEFLVCEGSRLYVEKLLQSFQPSEVLFSRSNKKAFEKQFGNKFYTYPIEEWVFMPDYTREKLLEHFQVSTLKGFGVEELELAQVASGAILHYLATTENTNLKHITSIARVQPDKFVWLDRFTIRNLELLHSTHETGIPLINILDQTISPMGARLMKKWVVLPLKERPVVEARHDIVEYYLTNSEFAELITKQIRLVGDIERLISKVPLGKVNPREVVQLKRALIALGPLKEALANSDNPNLEKMAERINLCQVMSDQIEREIIEEPPVNLAKGGVMKAGVSPELDELRNLVNNSKEILINIQQEEAIKTGIANLKIGFNNVFGYYLEVTNKYKNQGLIPENWVRKQTLTGSERYITDELKRLESKILGAEEKILVLEQDLYEKLVLSLNDYIAPVQQNAFIVARLDCLLSFSKIAKRHLYVRPEMNDSYAINIEQGRHPVIEQQLPIDDPFVPNDIYLDNDEQQLIMITGPNMSGKSAVLRQTALITLMAQMGSFVPAQSATLGMVDKVFTRVGASDNISSGESTFMVEMNETASIMNNISDRSLILLDEIGRGTSTYDGISIAWSIAEFLHNNQLAKPKTLFATHYHELNELAGKFPRIKNFNISTKEVGNKVIFLRKLVAGGSKHSFGIHVARMAGMPHSIVLRANDILHELEKQRKIAGDDNTEETLKQMPAEPMQLSIFESSDPTLNEIREVLENLDLNTMTPIECMIKLSELKKKLDED
ncbi:MAG: DNA mismatch repair protein MutS [Bacteroidota bacterium]